MCGVCPTRGAPVPDKFFRSVLPGEPARTSASCRRSTPAWPTSPASTTTGWAARTISRSTGKSARRSLQVHPETVLSVQANRRVPGPLGALPGGRARASASSSTSGPGCRRPNNTHEVAQAVAPGVAGGLRRQRPDRARARPGPADQQPAGRDGLPRRRPQGHRTTILAGAAQLLDLGQPVAVMLVAVLHMLRDDEDPQGVVDRLMAAVPAGSFLVISHLASDIAAGGDGRDGPPRSTRR